MDADLVVSNCQIVTSSNTYNGNIYIKDEKIIDESLKKLSRYFNFWIDYIYNNKNFDFEIVDY